VDGKSMWNRTAASGVFNGMRFRARPKLVFVLAGLLLLVAMTGVVSAGTAAQPSWVSLHRASRLRPLATGAPCPVAPLRRLDRGRFHGAGSGPVYPTGVSFSGDSRHPSWIASKTIWAWPTKLKTHAIRVLVRGLRLDQPGVMRFQLGPQWDSAPLTRELHINTSQTVGAFSNSTWGTTVTLLFVRTPGCYGIQLDCQLGTSTIIVHAKRP
jgi:hypothetical protein